MTTDVARWRQIGTNVDVVVSNGDLDCAARSVEATISAADQCLSRFRSDSELSIVNRSSGRRLTVSPLLATAVATALDAADATGGIVDPTVGRAVRLIGYDRDFSLVADSSGSPSPTRWQFESIPGWRAVDLDRVTRTLRVPGGVELDLDSTGKALIVDLALAAAAVNLSARAGLLVVIGGDLSVAGQPPRGGWRVQLAEDSRAPTLPDAPVAVIRRGALATSSTTVRRWRRNGAEYHHLIDPRTGVPSNGPWRTATTVAYDCVSANTSATCAVVLGAGAPDWLESRAIPARLVANDGTVAYVAGWPADLASEARFAAA